MLRSQEVSRALCKQAWKHNSLAPLGCALLLTSNGVGGGKISFISLLQFPCLFMQKVGARQDCSCQPCPQDDAG